MWPDDAKFRQSGYFLLLGKSIEVYLLFGKLLGNFWQNFDLIIWSHWVCLIILFQINTLTISCMFYVIRQRLEKNNNKWECLLRSRVKKWFCFQPRNPPPASFTSSQHRQQKNELQHSFAERGSLGRFIYFSLLYFSFSLFLSLHLLTGQSGTHTRTHTLSLSHTQLNHNLSITHTFMHTETSFSHHTSSFPSLHLSVTLTWSQKSLFLPLSVSNTLTHSLAHLSVHPGSLSPPIHAHTHTFFYLLCCGLRQRRLNRSDNNLVQIKSEFFFSTEWNEMNRPASHRITSHSIASHCVRHVASHCVRHITAYHITSHCITWCMVL